jgi:D-3-phosphoglycerate dehydrogenase
MKVVVLEPITQDTQFYSELEKKVNELGSEFIFYNTTPTDKEEAVSRAQEAEMLILCTYPLPVEVLKQLPKLRHVVVAFTGLDHIDLEYCKAQGIKVSNTPAYSTQAVAEQTLLMMLMLLRNAIEVHNNVVLGRDRGGFLGKELAQKTVGIIGFGRIGRKVAELCEAFGANIVVLQYKEIEHDRYRFLSMDRLLATSDIVTLHIPLRNENVHLLNREQIFKMKKGSYLINTARGKIVDYVALKEALIQGHLAGAAVDVFEMEPPLPRTHPLLDAPNIIFFPHTAYATHEAMARRSAMVSEIVIDWLKKSIQ